MVRRAGLLTYRTNDAWLTNVDGKPRVQPVLLSSPKTGMGHLNFPRSLCRASANDHLAGTHNAVMHFESNLSHMRHHP